jgi:hypothetical protein
VAKKPDEKKQPDEHDLLKQKVDEMMSLKGPAATAELDELKEEKSKKKTAPKSDVAAVAASINEELAANLDAPITQEIPTGAPELPGAKPVKKAEPTVEGKPAKVEPEASAEEISSEPAELAINEYDDSETEKAVDDITAQESDLVLAVEDLQRERRNPPEEPTKRSGWVWVLLAVFIILGVAGFMAYSGYGLKSLGL